MLVQMCPLVYLRVLGCELSVSHRTLGGITGSRVAGAEGVAIVADVIHARAHVWRPLGFRTESGCITLATWIDNIFAFGASGFSSTSILDDFADYVYERFRLEIKPSSREVLVCKGQRNCAEEPKWKRVTLLNMLGHFVSHHCGVRQD